MARWRDLVRWEESSQHITSLFIKSIKYYLTSVFPLPTKLSTLSIQIDPSPLELKRNASLNSVSYTVYLYIPSRDLTDLL